MDVSDADGVNLTFIRDRSLAKAVEADAKGMHDFRDKMLYWAEKAEREITEIKANHNA
jgi:hypothetical protein